MGARVRLFPLSGLSSDGERKSCSELEHYERFLFLIKTNKGFILNTSCLTEYR